MSYFFTNKNKNNKTKMAFKAEMLDFTKLKESEDNPRTDIDKKKIEELRQSIEEKGLLVPLIVTDNKDGTYKIIAGHRRFAALSILKNVPTKISCSIIEADSDEAQEIALIENVQREDLHKMDEAVEYQKRIQKFETTEEGIKYLSGKVGKPVVYISKVLSLNSLIPEIQKDFRADKIGFAHAIEIARLTVENQARVYKELFSESEINNKKVKYADTPQALRSWIDEHLINDLNKAPFKKDDALLYPAAGPCTTCPKRTGANKMLFNDITGDDRCTDPACFSIKIMNNVHMQVDAAMQMHGDKLLFCYNNEYGDSFKRYAKPLADKHKKKLVSASTSSYNDYQICKANETDSIPAYFFDNQQVVYVKKSVKQVYGRSDKKAKDEMSAEELRNDKQKKLKRSLELDRQAIHAQIIALMTKVPALTDTKTSLKESPASAIENWLFLLSAFNAMNYTTKDLVKKVIGFDPTTANYLKIVKLEKWKIEKAKKIIAFNQLKSTNVEADQEKDIAAAFIHLADQYKVDTKTVITAQNELVEKRMKRAKQFFDSLKKEKKSADKKPVGNTAVIPKKKVAGKKTVAKKAKAKKK